MILSLPLSVPLFPCRSILFMSLCLPLLYVLHSAFLPSYQTLDPLHLYIYMHDPCRFAPAALIFTSTHSAVAEPGDAHELPQHLIRQRQLQKRVLPAVCLQACQWRMCFERPHLCRLFYGKSFFKSWLFFHLSRRCPQHSSSKALFIILKELVLRNFS